MIFLNILHRLNSCDNPCSALQTLCCIIRLPSFHFLKCLVPMLAEYEWSHPQLVDLAAMLGGIHVSSVHNCEPKLTRQAKMEAAIIALCSSSYKRTIRPVDLRSASTRSGCRSFWPSWLSCFSSRWSFNKDRAALAKMTVIARHGTCLCACSAVEKLPKRRQARDGQKGISRLES